MGRAATRPGNIFALILLAMMGVQLGTAEWNRMRAAQDVGPEFASVWWPQADPVVDPRRARSIYYIILDAYARDDVLRELYNFDNSRFIEALEGRGFLVNQASRSNYSQTFLSLASSLNGVHVTPLSTLTTATARTRSTDRVIPFRLIRENRVMRVLQEQGYTLINIASGWGPTDILPMADRTVRCGTSEFMETLLRQTAAWPLVASEMKDDVHELRLCQLRSLEQTAGVPGPKFVLAHVILPHPPYVFDPQGQRVPGELTALGDEAPWRHRDLYVDQLRFVNRAILPVLDTLISKEKPHPIIVLQSDHGPASSSTGPWDPSNRALIRERMSILNAVYAPGRASLDSRAFLTPVTTFPVLLREYFGIHWDAPADSSYFSTSEEPFRFVPVDPILGSNTGSE